MDDFYEQQHDVLASRGLVPTVSCLNLIYTIVSATVILIAFTRVSSGLAFVRHNSTGPKRVPMTPYSIPIIGHSLSFFSDPLQFMSRLRDRNQDGIFAINIFSNTLNIVSNPHIVQEIMAQKDTALSFRSIAWDVLRRFFGFPENSKQKYMEVWGELNSVLGYLMREPYLSDMMERLTRGLEMNIPQMISFQESEIDLQLWERSAKTTYISPNEVESNLMALTYTLLGSSSIPALYGSALLDKYPNILQNIYAMDAGMNWFMIGIPAIFHMKSHIARRELWKSLDDQQKALDSIVEGKPVDLSWGDLDDVSEFIRKRHELFRDRGFKVNERGELSILWALTVNANNLVFWLILYILSTPGLLSRIREEVAPFAKIEKGIFIGKISEAPKLKIFSLQLSKKCPLLKSTYLEALRLVDQPWSVRKVVEDVVLSRKDAADSSFKVDKGSYVVIPHEIHMRDPAFFKDPQSFDPERFLVRNGDGTLSVDIGTIRPYGGGPSMCKGRIFAERECLAFVASILVTWDIEPVDPKAGWVIPKQQKTSAVSRPVHDIRVRIKSRSFD